MKKILLGIGFLFILLVIPATLFLVKQRQDIRQRAAPATYLYFEPSTITRNAGETFDVKVLINTGSNVVAAADLNLAFNPATATNNVKIVSIQRGAFFGETYSPPVVTDGTASITVGGAAAKQSTDTDNHLVTVTLEALADTAGSVNLEFTSDTQVGSIETSGNVLMSRDPLVITIGTGTGANPSPSSSPSVSPSSSPGGPAATPSPSPVTTISQPANGTTLTSKRPVFSGKTFNNGLVVLTISKNNSPVLTANVNATATGNWTYTATQDISNGSNYVITITGTPSDDAGTPEVTTLSFTMAAAGGDDDTGGPGNPSPAPSSSSTPRPSAGGTTASPKPSSSNVPVTGNATPTFFLLGVGLILALFGSGAIFLR